MCIDKVGLLCSAALVEAAIVCAVRPRALLLFVPRFHIRTTVHLLDRKGGVKPILATGIQPLDNAEAAAAQQNLRLETGEGMQKVLPGLLYESRFFQAFPLQGGKHPSEIHTQVQDVSATCHESIER